MCQKQNLICSLFYKRVKYFTGQNDDDDDTEFESGIDMKWNNMEY